MTAYEVPGLGVAVLDARTCALIAVAGPGLLERLRRDGLGVPADLVDALDVLRQVATAARLDLGGGSGAEPERNPSLDGSGSVATRLTVAEAATEIGISQSMCRRACRKGWIAAERHGDTWAIDPVSVAAYIKRTTGRRTT